MGETETFTKYFVQEVLRKANEFQDDPLLGQIYVRLTKLKLKKEGFGSIAVPELDMNIAEKEQDFTDRLSHLIAERDRKESERAVNAREDQLLILQQEVTSLSRRGTLFTIAATLFAGAAMVVSLMSFVVTYFQLQETKLANKLMAEQNDIMKQQNEIARDSLPKKKR